MRRARVRAKCNIPRSVKNSLTEWFSAAIERYVFFLALSPE